MIALELYGCAGGMAEGFRRAGIEFTWSVDADPNACESYRVNLGHRPVQCDVRDLLADWGAAVEAGADPYDGWNLDLLVADPPCTPWSRSGKRLGTADDRDMLEVTCDLIRQLRPRAYLIGNVPGLDDADNWQRAVVPLIGGLASAGYCTRDFARLDAAAFGGVILCLEHAPFAGNLSIPTHVMGCAALIGRNALRQDRDATNAARHSTSRPVGPDAVDAWLQASSAGPFMRRDPRTLIGEAGEHPNPMVDTCVCGAPLVLDAESIELSPKAYWDARSEWLRSSITSTRTSKTTTPRIYGSSSTKLRIDGSTTAATLVAGCSLCRGYATPQHRVRPWWFGHLGGPCLRWPLPTHGPGKTMRLDGCLPYVTCREALGHLTPEELGVPVRLVKQDRPDGRSAADVANGSRLGGHPTTSTERPSRTVTVQGTGRAGMLLEHPSGGHPPSRLTEPAKVITAARTGEGGRGGRVLVTDGQHPQSILDASAGVIPASRPTNGTSVLVTDTQRPHMDADEPARVIRAGSGGGARQALVLDHPPVDTGRKPSGKQPHPQSQRATPPDQPSVAVQGKDTRGAALEWPWPTPSTTVMQRDEIGQPGHHESGRPNQQPNAVKLSEKAAAILQGFPERWHFAGATKIARWSQIGQATPPALARAVATSVAEWFRRVERG